MTPATLLAWRSSPLGSVVDRLERGLVLDLAGELAGRDLLDLGCGDGSYALDAARRGARVVAVDLDRAMVDATRARAAQAGLALTARVADAAALPFPAASFDQVWLVTALCFAADPGRAVAEAARVLRPRGVLVLGELGELSPWALGRRWRRARGEPAWRGARFFTPGSLRRLVRGAGLVPEVSRAAVHAPRSARVARWVEPLDPWLGKCSRGLGAAFVAVRARRPEGA